MNKEEFEAASNELWTWTTTHTAVVSHLAVFVAGLLLGALVF